MNQVVVDQVATEKHWSPSDFLQTLRKNRWIMLLALLCGALGSIFYSLGQTKIYRARMTIQIDPKPPTPLGPDVQSVVDVGAGSSIFNRDYYKTQYDILQSRSLALKAVKQLGLAGDSNFQNNLPEGATVVEKEPTSREQNDERARAALQSRLTIAPVRESRLVEITFDDAQPERARRVLRTLVEIYIDNNVDTALASTTLASEWLGEQLQKLKSELSDNEVALYRFKKDNQILSVALDDQSNMLRDEMQQLSQALTGVRTQIESLKARNAELEKIAVDDPIALPANELLESTVLADRRAEYVNATKELEGLTGSGKGQNHPEAAAARARVEVAKHAVLTEVQNIREALQSSLTARISEARGLEGLLASAKTRALDLNRLGLDYRRLERAKENTEKVYSLVLERTKESDLTRHMRFNNILVVDDAMVDSSPVKPHTPLNILVGAALGLFFGVIGSFGRDSLDRTFKHIRDVEEQLHLPVLGVLPKVKVGKSPRSRGRRRGPPTGEELLVHEKPGSLAAEAARSLRTNITFASPDRTPRTLLVTSGGPLDGKTTVACWVAIALAQAGKRVLLMDCDLRRPRVSEVFKRSTAHGVSTLVVGEDREFDVSTEIPNLDVMASGPRVPNPAELLQSERFDRVLESLGAQYDQIVIDSPPVNAVTDATILSTKVDSVIFVVRAHGTTRESAQQSVRTLGSVGKNILGVALNAFDANHVGYGYGYKYYGYSSEDELHRS